MLSYQDCVELSDLTEEEIEAIAEHEHLPEIAALEMGSYLVPVSYTHLGGAFRASGRRDRWAALPENGEPQQRHPVLHLRLPCNLSLIHI